MQGTAYGFVDHVIDEMRYYYPRQRRRRERQPYAIVLALQLFQKIANLKKKPSLTLVLMVAMSLLHVKSDLFQDFMSSSGRHSSGHLELGWWNIGGWYHHDFVHSVCLLPNAMWDTYRRTGWFDFKRFFLSPVTHADDMHLCYNMISFLSKGMSLELTMHRQNYVGLLLFSTFTSQALLLLASVVLMALGADGAMQSCTVGFSGVLFALKYVAQRRSPGVTEASILIHLYGLSAFHSPAVMFLIPMLIVMGFKIDTRYATWLELLLISIFFPNASFLGHLMGILTGIIYLEFPIIALFLRFLVPTRVIPSMYRRPRYTYTSGTASSGTARAPAAASSRTSKAPSPVKKSSPSQAALAAEQEELEKAIRRSLENSGGLDVEEEGSVSENPRVVPSAPNMEADMTTAGQNNGGGNWENFTSMNEMRRRRLQRLG